MKKIRNYSIYLVLFLGLGISCNTDPEPRELFYYEDSEKFLNYSAQQLKDLFNAGGIVVFNDLIDYEIIVYKFYYKTNYKGDEIIASGLLSVPITDDPVPMVAFNHGTIAAHDDAPSVNVSGYANIAYFASFGYIIAIPDYIGFGSSEDILHPYYVAETYGDAVVDMLQAAEEFVDIEGGNFNGDVFLSGYSEGGYATMAAHKAMEDNPLDRLELVASAPAAGGYDLKHFQEHYFALDTYAEPFFMAYVGASYHDYYDISAPLSDYFQEPYATNIPDLVGGDFGGGTINSNLTEVVADFLQPDFLANIDTDSKYSEFVTALETNDLSNWVPQKPMYLYHGDEDITVPYENSVVTYDKMLTNGASPSVVTFTALTGEDHYTGGLPYFFELLELLDELN